MLGRSPGGTVGALSLLRASGHVQRWRLNINHRPFQEGTYIAPCDLYCPLWNSCVSSAESDSSYNLRSEV